jgi:hypothetical protein
VVSVGGGANIPAVTTTLSGRLRVPVVTTARPQLTAAIGGALRAVRGPGDTSATVLTPAAPAAVGSALLGAEVSRASGEAVTSEPISVMMPALTWAETHDDSRVMPAGSGAYPRSSGGSGYTGYTAARPSLNFEHEELPRPEPEPEPKILPWYRLPAVVMIGTAVALLLVGMAVAMGLSSDNNPAPAPGVNSTPAPASAPPANGGTPQSAPANPPPAATDPGTVPPAAPAADAPDVPAPQAPAPAAPPPVPVPPVAPRIPPIPAIPRIPGIPLPHGR